MVPNCMSSMTRKASGTWSSDRDSEMSAAAEYFYKKDQNQPHYSTFLIITISLLCVICCNNVCYPESPVSIYGNNEVDDINEKHESVDVAHGTVIWVDYVVKKLSYGQIDVKSSAGEQIKTLSSYNQNIHLVARLCVCLCLLAKYLMTHQTDWCQLNSRWLHKLINLSHHIKMALMWKFLQILSSNWVL